MLCRAITCKFCAWFLTTNREPVSCMQSYAWFLDASLAVPVSQMQGLCLFHRCSPMPGCASLLNAVMCIPLNCKSCTCPLQAILCLVLRCKSSCASLSHASVVPASWMQCYTWLLDAVMCLIFKCKCCACFFDAIL
jgi:hypothetical protein